MSGDAQRGHFERDATVHRLPCPTCTGPIRETVGMVCQTCGTDYGGESLAIAACCYALPPQMRKWRQTGAEAMPTLWPWAPGRGHAGGEGRAGDL